MEDFYKDVDNAVTGLDEFRRYLLDNRLLRVTDIDRTLSTTADMSVSTRILVQSVLESGKVIFISEI